MTYDRLNMATNETSYMKKFVVLIEMTYMAIDWMLLLIINRISLKYQLSFLQNEKSPCRLEKLAKETRPTPPGMHDYEDLVQFYRSIHRMPYASQWVEPDASAEVVRGLTYPQDKQKIPAGPSGGVLLHVDLIRLPVSMQRLDHIAAMDMRRANSIVRTFLEKHPDEKLFVVNFQLPGTPKVTLACYWAILPKKLCSINARDLKFRRLFNEFLSTDDDRARDARLKIIPRIREGPWVVTNAVSQKPAMIGQKVKTRYFRGPNYVEVDFDLGSSFMSGQIVSVCRGYARHLTVDVSFVLQGEEARELPEKVFGSVRFQHIDLELAQSTEEAFVG